MQLQAVQNRLAAIWWVVIVSQLFPFAQLKQKAARHILSGVVAVVR